jgi:HK97 gp10 family phage protein
MPVQGIQNFDKILERCEKMQEACREKTQQDALKAAGEVLRNALMQGTPIGPGGRKTASGNARANVLNVRGRMKEYGVSRQLIGYSKAAFYMLYRQTGFRLGARRKDGKPVRAKMPDGRWATLHPGQSVPARPNMSSIFKQNIGPAMDAARAVIRKAAGF